MYAKNFYGGNGIVGAQVFLNYFCIEVYTHCSKGNNPTYIDLLSPLFEFSLSCTCTYITVY